MKNIFLLLCLIFVTENLSSQVKPDTLGTERLDSPTRKIGYDKIQPVATYDNGYVFVMPGTEEGLVPSKTVVERMDAHLKNILSVELNLKDKNGIRNFCNLINFDDKLWLLTTFCNNQDKKIYLFANTLDKYTLKTNDDIRMIASFDKNTNRKSVVLASDFAVSKDSSKLMVLVHGVVLNKYATVSTNEKNLMNVESSVCVFNRDMFKIWQRPLNNAISSASFVRDRMEVDNAGNCFVSGQSYRSSEAANQRGRFVLDETPSRYLTYELQPTNFYPSILYFGQTGLESREYLLKIPSVFLRSMNFKLDGERLFCYGVYCDSGHYSAKGVYTCTVDLFSGNIGNIHLNTFSDQVRVPQIGVAELDGFQKVTTKYEWDPYDYACSKLMTRSNGDLVFIAEQQWWGYIREDVSRVISTYPHMEYRNLYVITLTPDGQLKKMDVVGRVQTTIHQHAVSYEHMNIGDDLYLLFMNSHRVATSNYMTVADNLTLLRMDKDGHSSSAIVHRFIPPTKLHLFMGIWADAWNAHPWMDAVLLVPDEKAFVFYNLNTYFPKHYFLKLKAQ